MNNEFALELPVNGVSFGQVSTSILREIYSRGYEPCLFSIGNIDVSSQKIDKEFGEWLNKCLSKAFSSYKKDIPVIKLWHLSGLHQSVSSKQIAITFYECDSPTAQEVNIARNQHKLVLTNSFASNLFCSFGLNNVETIPLGFDKWNFHIKNKKYYHDDRIVFGLSHKWEHRKHTAKIIKAWIKKFGNNGKYFLNAAIFNPFFKPEDNAALINNTLEGKKYFNINFLPWMPSNDTYNDFLNSNSIIIDCSGGEGWSAPSFTSVALGKHAVLLRAHAFLDWGTAENAVFIDPCGKVDSHDGAFFHKGQIFNQGSFFTFEDDAFIAGCEEAIKRVQSNPVNKAGLELQNKFTYKNTVDELLKLTTSQSS